MNKLDQGLRRCQRVTESSLAASPRWVRLDMACALFALWEMPEPINRHLRIEKGQCSPWTCTLDRQGVPFVEVTRLPIDVRGFD
jgi:hypothetical protein